MESKGILRRHSQKYLFSTFTTILFFMVVFIIQNCAASDDFYINGDQSVTIWRVQVSAKTTQADAQIEYSNLGINGITNVQIDPPTITHWYRVLVGPYSTKSASNEMVQKIKALGYKDAYSVTMDITLETALKMNLHLEDTLYQQLLSDTTYVIKGATDQVFRQSMNRWVGISKDTIPTAPLDILPDIAAVIRKSPDSIQAKRSPFYIGQIYAAVYYRMKMAKNLDDNAKKRYLAASIDAMNDYIAKNPEGEYVPLALKQIADCRHASSGYSTPNLQKTATAYRKVLDNHGNSSIAAETQLQYAGVLFELAVNKKYSWDSVRLELDNVVIMYPQADRSKHSRAKMMGAETYFYQNNFKMMITRAQEMLKDYPDVEQDQIYGSYLVGYGYQRINKYAESISILTDVLSRTTTTKNTDPLIPSAKSSSLFLLAWDYYHINEFEQCQNMYDSLMKDHPNSREAVCARNYFGINKIKKSSISPVMVKTIPDYVPSILAYKGAGNE